MSNEKLINFIKKHGIKLATNTLNSLNQNNKSKQISNHNNLDIKKYEDGDRFIKEMETNMAVSITNITPDKMLAFVEDFVSRVNEVQRFCEVQETKRAEINAKRDILIRQIEREKEIILEYLKEAFDERRKCFDKLFSIVDKAIENGNNEQLSLALQSINILASESPFKVLSSTSATQKALKDKDHEWNY